MYRAICNHAVAPIHDEPARMNGLSERLPKNRAVRWLRCTLVVTSVLLTYPMASLAGPAADALPKDMLLASRSGASPVANAAFHPGPDAAPAPALHGVISIRQSALRSDPEIENPVQKGRDARLFPGIEIELFTLDDLLVPVRRGELLRETSSGATPSYWNVIPQTGRIWRERADDGWSRAALPLMLVNDTENHAHQGLATFLYRDGEVSAVTLQFVQQTAPYLLGRHFVAWGVAPADLSIGDAKAFEDERAAVRREMAARLPAQPWSEIVGKAAPGILDGFGGPLDPKWRVTAALVHEGTLYYQESATPYGPYPYPLEMRFGVRSVMKSVGAPLALLRLAEVYGPYVLTLKIGDYVKGIDPKWQRIRFIDAANMASGFGGTGNLTTHPNLTDDGALKSDYDAWYTAPSHADKLAQINSSWRPYPWEPGVVMRYRDQDFYLLGAALQGFLTSVRGPKADLWEMLQTEVFEPIGIYAAPAVRTRETNGTQGLVWLNAGYYPTLDDLAKLALFYQNRGMHDGRQLLHRELTTDLLAARDAIRKDGDASVDVTAPPDAAPASLYRMGFHFVPYATTTDGKLHYLPTMTGFGQNEVSLYPNGLVSIVIGKEARFEPGLSVKPSENKEPVTARIVERFAPF